MIIRQWKLYEFDMKEEFGMTDCVKDEVFPWHRINSKCRVDFSSVKKNVEGLERFCREKSTSDKSYSTMLQTFKG